MSIKLKFATKGALLNTDVHEKFDVANLPYQNLPKAHPVRESWQQANKDKKWNDVSKTEVPMRPPVKTLGSGDRSDSLSYDKLVRSTAVRMHKAGLSEDDAEFFIGEDKTRLFQNLVACIGMDDISFQKSIEALDEAIEMFIDDVTAEYPHAKPTAGGGKSKAEIEAEIKAKTEEANALILDEVKVYVNRVPTEHGVNGVPFPNGASIDMLQGAYDSEKEKLEHNIEADGVPEMLERLEAWSLPFKQFWGV